MTAVRSAGQQRSKLWRSVVGVYSRQFSKPTSWQVLDEVESPVAAGRALSQSSEV